MPSKKNATIGEIVLERLETVSESDTAQDAAKRMSNSNLSSLLVLDNSGGTATGIVTERDLVRKVCASDEKSSNVVIQKIMSKPLITVDTNEMLQEAANIMIQNKVRHLLVVGHDGARGIISTRNFANYLRQNVNMDEVNAAIIDSLIKQEAEGMPP